MSLDDREYSIAAVSRELRNEICSIAKINLESGPSPFPHAHQLPMSDKRLLVRSVFTFVESLSYLLKIQALHLLSPDQVSFGDRLVAQEEAFELGDDGVVKQRAGKLRTISNIRFAFKFYAKAYENDFELDVASRGWQCLRRSLKVRDRLTHPKKLSDLLVADDEYTDSVKTFIWFERQIMRAQDSLIRAQEAALRALKKEISDRGLRKMGTSAPLTPMPPPPPGIDDDV